MQELVIIQNLDYYTPHARTNTNALVKKCEWFRFFFSFLKMHASKKKIFKMIKCRITHDLKVYQPFVNGRSKQEQFAFIKASLRLIQVLYKSLFIIIIIIIIS